MGVWAADKDAGKDAEMPASGPHHDPPSTHLLTQITEHPWQRAQHQGAILMLLPRCKQQRLGCYDMIVMFLLCGARPHYTPLCR